MLSGKKKKILVLLPVFIVFAGSDIKLLIM